MLRELIGQAAGLIIVVSIVPYVIAILKGETKPARMTYFIKSVINVVTIIGYIGSGARDSIYTGLIYTFTALLVLGLSFKYGMGGFSKLDIICLGIAMIGIIASFSTHDAAVALYVGIFVKLIADVPLYQKTYHFPGTENKTSWYMVMAGDTLNLFAITSLVPHIAALPIYDVISTAIVVALLLRQSRREHIRFDF